MDFISSNWRDIDKYYSSTFVKFSEFGDKLFFITQVSPEMVQGIDEDDTAFQLHLSDKYPYTVNYLLPHKATFQWNDSVYLLQRIPARQYRRGLCADNTMITNVVTGSKLELDFSALKAFVAKPRYSSFTDAFTGKSKRKSVALTSRMTYQRTGFILIDSNKVAQYDYSLKKIIMIRPIFTPEIQQHMLDNNEHYEVIGA